MSNKEITPDEINYLLADYRLLGISSSNFKSSFGVPFNGAGWYCTKHHGIVFASDLGPGDYCGWVNVIVWPTKSEKNIPNIIAAMRKAIDAQVYGA